jgi:large subunit ribosomal protein L10Ae
MSKLNGETLKTQIAAVLVESKSKLRKFVETIELQVGLKNYDPMKDKRFAGT